MNIQMLSQFFMWCTILNFGLLIFSALFLSFAGNFVYKVHGKLFPMPRATFNVVLYSFLCIYKILWLVLNLVPWMALEIMG